MYYLKTAVPYNYFTTFKKADLLFLIVYIANPEPNQFEFWIDVCIYYAYFLIGM